MKHELETKAFNFDPSLYWSSHELQLSVMAFQSSLGSSTSSAPAPAPLYNTYENYPSGRRLSETVPEFLARLPPFTSQIGDHGPWIYISNPSYRDEPTKEDLRGFKQEGGELLREFSSMKAGMEASMSGQISSVVGRKLAPLRKKLEQDIYALASKKGVTAGK